MGISITDGLLLGKKWLMLVGMKSEIHPKYFPSSQIKCACGNVLTVGSTREKMEVEVCSACHPFFTGKAKVLDAAGRVERFKARAAKKIVKRK